jgi:hypothetical protein
MTVTVMREQSRICCPGCHSSRVVSPTWSRRSAKAGGTLCTSCRGRQSVRKHRESDLRFWLSAFGVVVPARTPVRQFLAAGGAPPELVELAKQVWPPAKE